MTETVKICGVGAVGGFGVGLNALSEALVRGGEPNARAAVELAGGPVELPMYSADPSSLREYVNRRKLRRMDRFSRLAGLGASLALLDAGLDQLEDRSRIGVVMATGYGASETTFAFLDSSFDDGDACVSPTVFSNSVHSAAASNITILHEITGPCLTVSQFEMSVPVALQSACQWLADGLVDYVLFGACDEYCPVLGYCYGEMFGEPSKRIEPFVFDRQTAVVGEAAAFLVLSRGTAGNPYARISSVQLGRLSAEPIAPPEDTPVLLAAGGHRQCGRQYRRALQTDALRAAYSPVYGSLPTAPALDLVIAALACRRGRLWPCRVEVPDGMPVVQSDRPVAETGVASLAVDAEGAYGFIHVVPEKQS